MRPGVAVFEQTIWGRAMTDRIHHALAKSIERRQRACLWTPSDAITFIPRVLPTVFGDGRALFTLSTVNQRPAYWVVRGCSTWSEDDFSEHGDEILTALEEAFGNGRCGYSGNNLFQSKRERKKWCDCDDCLELPIARWPMVDGDGGYSWGRLDWPTSFPTLPSPDGLRGTILASESQAASNHVTPQRPRSTTHRREARA